MWFIPDKKLAYKNRLMKAMNELYGSKKPQILYICDDFFVYGIIDNDGLGTPNREKYFKQKCKKDFIFIEEPAVEIEIVFKKVKDPIGEIESSFKADRDMIDEQMQGIKKALVNYKYPKEVVIPFPKDKIAELYAFMDVAIKQGTKTAEYNKWAFIESVLPEVKGCSRMGIIDNDILHPQIEYIKIYENNVEDENGK